MAIKVVGKSSGWKGDTETYKVNKGDVGNRRIVFVGASYLFVHKVLRDMLLVGGFKNCHLVVNDIDPEPMNIVADLLTRIARQRHSNITVSRTLDRRDALKGADIVVLSITTGGQEADQRSYEVCAKYGVPVAVGDTMGPAALARNLRAIPVVLDIIRDVQELAPRAMMLNFTNPMSCITGVMARNSSVPCFGLCHSADEMFRYMAEIFHVKKKDVDLEIGGVNHQAFVTKALIKGKDRTKEILAASLASKAKFQDTLLTTKEEDVKLQRDICEILGAWPSTGDTHLAEFYKHFMTPRRVESLQHGLRGKILPGRESFGRKECPKIIHEWTYGAEPVGDLHLLTSEHAHEVMWAYLTGEPYTRILNLLNTGEYLKGIPKTACVEALVTITGKKITGKQIILPTAVHELVSNWTAIHELSIQAAINCDRDAARQALFLDPHVNDMYDIKPMLEDMLAALGPWLPAKWFKTKTHKGS